MTYHLKIVGAMTATFLVLDLVWLGVVARGFYQDRMGSLLRPDVQWPAALLLYGLIIAGIAMFVVYPALGRESLLRAALYGGFFGLVTYGTYDLTNLALARGFPVSVAIVDMVWGTALSASVAAAGYFAGRVGA